MQYRHYLLLVALGAGAFSSMACSERDGFTSRIEISAHTAQSPKVLVEDSKTVSEQNQAEDPTAQEGVVTQERYVLRAEEFWKDYKDEDPLGYQDWRSLGKEELSSLSTKDKEEVQTLAQRIAKGDLYTRAVKAWQEAHVPTFRSLNSLREAEACRIRGEVSRENLGMTDVAVGRVIVRYHAHMAQQLWWALENPKYDKWQLFVESGHAEEHKSRDDTNTPPLDDCLKAINRHLERAYLTPRDIGMTNEAIAKVLARQGH